MIKELLTERKLPALKCREEMLDLLLTKEYGILPPKPDKTEWKVEKNALPHGYCAEFCAGKGTVYRVTAEMTLGEKTFSFPFYAAIPNSEGKHPFFVSINFHDAVPDIWMPTEELIDNGFAVLSFCYTHVTSDNNDFTDGLAGVLYEEGKRGPADAGKIAMWAWAAQRVLDYALTLDVLDEKRCAVCGHSRLGKTALLAAATDERFAFCYSNESGCSGAALSRGKEGESKERICHVFPFWFCEDYCAAPADPAELPFDQHYLVASIAPRFVLVGSAEDDGWADPVSEFLSAAAASEAYEAMGLTGLICDDAVPAHDAFLPEGHIGYHIRPGSHYFGRTDWNRLMQFMNRHS